jgi:hypothetical protein
MNVDLAKGGHWLHADVAIAIQVCIGAYVLMFMLVMFHRHHECKTWRAASSGLACREYGRGSEL